MPHARISPKGITSWNAAFRRVLNRTILHPTTAQSLVSVRSQVQAVEKKVLPAQKLQPTERIYGLSVDSCLEMEVGTGRITGRSHQGDSLSLLDSLAGFDKQSRTVSIQCG